MAEEVTETALHDQLQRHFLGDCAPRLGDETGCPTPSLGASPGSMEVMEGATIKDSPNAAMHVEDVEEPDLGTADLQTLREVLGQPDLLTSEQPRIEEMSLDVSIICHSLTRKPLERARSEAAILQHRGNFRECAKMFKACPAFEKLWCQQGDPALVFLGGLKQAHNTFQEEQEH